MKTVKDYLDLPYTKIVKWDSHDEIFVARVKEIEGCTAHGDTEAEALEMLRDNLEDWITFSLEEGDSIPLPETEEKLPSGKWLLRVPKTLHKQLIECAEREGVSLNSFVAVSLAKTVGAQEAEEKYTTNVIDMTASQATPKLEDFLYANRVACTVPHAPGQIYYRSSQSKTLDSKAKHCFFSEDYPPVLSKPYVSFVDNLSGNIPSRPLTIQERRPYDDKEEEIERRAYA